MINDYGFLCNEEEINLLKNSMNNTLSVIDEINSGNVNYSQVYEILSYERALKPLIFKSWIYEYNNGNKYISWFKYDKLRNIDKVLSATFGSNESFCESRYGISFEVNIDGFLGACNKDAATLIEKNNKQSVYTIGIDKNNNVINSYNLATPLITPKQVFNQDNNDYMSIHNEIILDSRYIKPVSVVYTDNNDIEMVKLISQTYNIPIELIKIGHTK